MSMEDRRRFQEVGGYRKLADNMGLEWKDDVVSKERDEIDQMNASLDAKAELVLALDHIRHLEQDHQVPDCHYCQASVRPIANSRDRILLHRGERGSEHQFLSNDEYCEACRRWYPVGTHQVTPL